MGRERRAPSAVIPGRCAASNPESRGSGSGPSDHPGTTDKKLKGSVIVADGVRKDEEFSGTKEVEERHRINEANLDGWMREHVEGYKGPLKVLQFKGGQSNPTYKIETPGRSYVMRLKPFGKLLPSAHACEW